MKKLMMMVAVALMTAVSANAQSEQPKNEIGISYGLGSMIPVSILMNRWFVRHRALAIAPGRVRTWSTKARRRASAPARGCR